VRAFEYRHIVGFEETNLVGNVYYVNHLRWQGRCREMFLREHAPAVLEQLSNGLILATVHCSCDNLEEVRAFDEILVRMRLTSVAQNRISLGFEYWRVNADREQLIARGRQEVACMRRDGPTPVPNELRQALLPYGA